MKIFDTDIFKGWMWKLVQKLPNNKVRPCFKVIDRFKNYYRWGKRNCF